jgi:hypothetical protein
MIYVGQDVFCAHLVLAVLNVLKPVLMFCGFGAFKS